ncbi:ABC transporter substrate-binding protein [Pseudogracilibacillus auburnensis]|uniref:ABC transporter substrate-binding protein n=1 Tax=Pseudogracilibacillus auburnensis TaxID=1494959 RepID=UPI001A972209|nr:ABC transporter substrate-binding protein [Pseudogracilibacillus auburnensis]MBO1005891.1 ABC transporter substrate-binding protein [Pseudogracilibacillus auburnensis]
MKRITLFCCFTFIMLTLFSACSSKDVSEIKLAEVTRSVFYTPQYVAIENGYFEEEGLEVDLQTTWGGDKTMTALLSDNADIALVGSETSIYVYAQDASDIVINFAQLTQTDGTFLVSKSDKPNFTWEDTKNSIFLGQRKGGMPQMVGEFVLKKHNIDPHDDLELIQNIDFANIPGAFVSGDAEYVQLFEPTASMFEKEGKGHVIASFGEESDFLPYTVFMTKESYLVENEDIVKSFTKAIYKAQQWVQETDSEEIAKVVQPYFEDTELDILASSIERYKQQDSFAETPLLSEESWNHLQAIMEEAGELPKQAPYDELVNTDIANEVTED